MTVKDDISVTSKDAESFSGRFMFILVTAASAVGFGNVWRFPYLVYENGGLVFILIYLLTLILIVLPIVMLEMGLGQVLRGGQMQSWAKLGRRCRAPGISSWASFTICNFYQIIVTWSMIFFFNSFTTEFPWGMDTSMRKTCLGEVTEAACLGHPYCNWRGDSCMVDSLYNSREFFRNSVFFYDDFDDRDKDLKITTIAPMLALSSFILWIFTFFCVFAGARILGYTTYFTMGLPAVLMIALVCITSTFEGSGQGIREYIVKFKINSVSSKTIINAVTQGFFSLSVGQGCLTTIASHNSKGDNFVENAIIIASTDTMFSILSGFAVYSTIGFLALQSNLPVDELKVEGIGLAFSAYPAAIAQLPRVISTIVALVFFFMLCLLGFSTICTLIEALDFSLINSRFGRYYGIKRWHFTAMFCAFFFLAPGLFLATEYGFAFLSILDNYSAQAQGFASASQAICVGWFYSIAETQLRAGKKSVLIHSLTFFTGAILLGILDKVNIIAALILGFGIPIIGYIAAIYMFDASKDETIPPNTGLSLVDKVHRLGTENVDYLRSTLNNAIMNKKYVFLPSAWSYLIKYVIPFLTTYLFVTGITDRASLFDLPNGENRFPTILFFLAAASPILMIASFILITIWPNLIQWLVPPDLDDSVIPGQEYYQRNKARMLDWKELRHCA